MQCRLTHDTFSVFVEHMDTDKQSNVMSVWRFDLI